MTDLLTQIVYALRAGEIPLHLAIELDVPGALVAAWKRGAMPSIIEIRTFVDAGDLLRDLEELCEQVGLDANELDSYGSAQTYSETAHLTAQERSRQFGKSADEALQPVDWLRMASREAIEVGHTIRNIRSQSAHADRLVIVKLRGGWPPSLTALLDAIQRNGGKP